MRLSGLASGFDTDTMVQNLMRVERMKVDRYTQKKQINLWRQEQYQSTNKDIANFIINSKKNMGLNKVSSTGAITPGSYKNLDYMTKAVSSKDDVVGVTTTGSSTKGSFTVKVNELANSANLTSGEISNEDFKGIKEMDLNLGGTSVKVTGKNDGDITVNDLVKAINGAKKETADGKEVGLGMSAFYDKNSKRIFIQQEATDDIFNSINNGNAGNKFDIDIKIESVKGDESKLEGVRSKFTPGEGSDPKGAIAKAGNIAKVEINGVEMYSKDNNMKFNGLNLELKSTGVETTIKVDTNTDGIIEKIQGLVNEYNELLEGIAKVTGEKRYPSFHPLSDEEKKEMTEDDIKFWEEKAKSGMLNNDETINRTLQNIRTNLFKNVEGLDGKFKNITEIGITTEKYSQGAVGGKLQINEAKLRQAIEEDADGVMELLFSEEKDVELDTSSNIGSTNKGVFTGIYDGLVDGMKAIIDKSGPGEDKDLLRNVKSNILLDFVSSKGSISDLDRDINKMNMKIADMETLLAKKEEGYYKQFTAMEKYMYKMNSQSDWLMQQMMM